MLPVAEQFGVLTAGHLARAVALVEGRILRRDRAGRLPEPAQPLHAEPLGSVQREGTLHLVPESHVRPRRGELPRERGVVEVEPRGSASRWGSVRRRGEREVELRHTDARSPRLQYGRAHQHMTEVVRRVVALERIGDDVVDTMAEDRRRELVDQTKCERRVARHDHGVERAVGETPEERTRRGVRGRQHPSRRAEPRAAGRPGAVGQHEDDRTGNLQPTVQAQLVAWEAHGGGTHSGLLATGFSIARIQ